MNKFKENLKYILTCVLLPFGFIVAIIWYIVGKLQDARLQTQINESKEELNQLLGDKEKVTDARKELEKEYNRLLAEYKQRTGNDWEK